jgi:hypothetical protein
MERTSKADQTAPKAQSRPRLQNVRVNASSKVEGGCVSLRTLVRTLSRVEVDGHHTSDSGIDDTNATIHGDKLRLHVWQVASRAGWNCGICRSQSVRNG